MNANREFRPAEAPHSEVSRPRRMSVARQLLIFLLLLGLAGGGYAAWRQYAAEDGAGDAATAAVRPLPVVLAEAANRMIASRVEAVGTTMSRRAIEVVPLASGRIEEIAFEPGQVVEAGTVLARLDDDIERADLAEAEAALQETVLALQRAQALRQKNAVPEATVDQLVAAQASGRAEVDRARRRLADRTVRAPFAGLVGLRQVDLGARVDEDTVLTTLDDRSEIEIEFSVPESLYGAIEPGQSVLATSAAFPDRTFEGRIVTIDSRIDPTSRAFKVRAVIPNRDLALPAGMFMHAAVVLEARQAIMVPEEAVTVQGSRTFVYVVADGTAHLRTVRTGHREVGAVEIVEGLAAGEFVVVRGTPRLRDGAAVEAVEDGEAALPGTGGAAPAGPA